MKKITEVTYVFEDQEIREMIAEKLANEQRLGVIKELARKIEFFATAVPRDIKSEEIKIAGIKASVTIYKNEEKEQK